MRVGLAGRNGSEKALGTAAQAGVRAAVTAAAVTSSNVRRVSRLL